MRDGLTVVSTIPQEGDFAHSSTELNGVSMQFSPIKTSVSDTKDGMQISPIKASGTVKYDVMQISPLKTVVLDKEDVMQISPLKTSVSDKDVMDISPLKTTVSDIKDVNLICLKHPHTAINNNPDVRLPESFSEKEIDAH